MRNLFLIIATFISIFHVKTNAQVNPCSSTITVEATSPNPQSGAHNYFGVKVTLNQAYTTNVTVNGYIHDDDDESNTSHPFEVVVTVGNTSNETSLNFYQTGPTSNASITISSITPYFVSNGSSYFNLFGDCTANTQAVVDTAALLTDSLEVGHVFLNNIIELDDDEYLSFLRSITKYGPIATALTYNIDSNDVYAFIERSTQAIDNSIDFIKVGLFGSKPLDSLTYQEILTLGEHIVNANLASRVAPEEIGGSNGSCLGSLLLGVYTAWSELTDPSTLAFINCCNHTEQQIEHLKKVAVKIFLNTCLQYLKIWSHCVD